MAGLIMIGDCACLLSAIKLLVLDSQLLDLDANHDVNSGFNKALWYITLDSFDNNDECKAKTWFTKQAITTMLVL
jgi:hypothetical protein